ncbi:hypothetical protein ANTRET_LOCUS4867 [Anthophora retusa]
MIKAPEEQKYCSTLFVNIEKAFDRVCHLLPNPRYTLECHRVAYLDRYFTLSTLLIFLPTIIHKYQGLQTTQQLSPYTKTSKQPPTTCRIISHFSKILIS